MSPKDRDRCLIFFGFYFLFAKTPEKTRMDNRSPAGVCEKHTEGASGNQYTEVG